MRGNFFINLFKGFDVVLFVPAFFLALFGLVTMYSYVGSNIYFEQQVVWIILALLTMFLVLIPDYRFLKDGHNTFYIYLLSIAALLLVLFFGEIVKGAQSRFDVGAFSIQPSEPAKLILIIVLAKYFSKRHIEIAHFKHILVSGVYALIVFSLVFLQPDFGSAIIIFCIWFGLVLVSGISARHLGVVTGLGILAFLILWSFGFQDYQKERIMTFLHPLADIQGAGYNAYQSTIAVGSGEWFGKGVGYGTQSKLQFLPEYETDFIFAAFAEEWGIIGVVVLFILFGLVIWRVLWHALHGISNFERLFCIGIAILIISHFLVHIGMNIGLLPVTGTTVPFLSYGGTHLLIEFIGIGMVMALSRNRLQYVARSGVDIVD
jgi:rod shape determining protein RodA